MRMLVRLLLETHRHQELGARASASFLGILRMARREREVVQGRQLREEVELLKDDSDASIADTWTPLG